MKKTVGVVCIFCLFGDFDFCYYILDKLWRYCWRCSYILDITWLFFLSSLLTFKFIMCFQFIKVLYYQLKYAFQKEHTDTTGAVKGPLTLLDDSFLSSDSFLQHLCKVFSLPFVFITILVYLALRDDLLNLFLLSLFILVEVLVEDSICQPLLF